MTHRIGTLGFAVALLFATSARAQISAPPTLQGQPSVHVWTVPGVINNGGLGTFFTCTNTLGSTVTVGVEVFGPAGEAALDDASATSLSVAPGATVMFGTTQPGSFVADGNLAPGFVTKRSARVLATTSSKASPQILCTALLADSISSVPTVMTTLPVIRKTTQQGD